MGFLLFLRDRRSRKNNKNPQLVKGEDDMKLVTFELEGKQSIGAMIGDQIADLSQAGFSGTLRDLIAAGPDALQKVADALAAGTCPLVDLKAVKLLAPVTNPSKIIAIGLNYRDHALEQNVPLPKAPLIFAKFPSSVNGPYDPIRWDPALTQMVDYEVELGVVIGKKARRVSEADALEYVFGYTVINDTTARDLQYGDKQWVRGKSLDTFCPMGPVVVTADEIPDPQALGVRCLVNGEVRQDSNTVQMVFGVRELVAYCSRAFTLEPGDLIATGTPNGVGVYRKPPVYLQNGDVVVTEVEGIGRLENTCVTENI
jgi:2-keto-4-pentenoate hydratase/2-oxohepta-3-ene-1,7-dioic acid hydratase in catechol pathway